MAGIAMLWTDTDRLRIRFAIGTFNADMLVIFFIFQFS